MNFVFMFGFRLVCLKLDVTDVNEIAAACNVISESVGDEGLHLTGIAFYLNLFPCIIMVFFMGSCNLCFCCFRYLEIPQSCVSPIEMNMPTFSYWA